MAKCDKVRGHGVKYRAGRQKRCQPIIDIILEKTRTSQISISRERTGGLRIRKRLESGYYLGKNTNNYIFEKGIKSISRVLVR